MYGSTNPSLRFLPASFPLLALLVLTAALSQGCAHAGSQRGISKLSSLRTRAERAPGDVVVQRQLLLAEMFAYDGDPSKVDAQVARALAAGEDDARLWVAVGLHHDTHGHPGDALTAYLRALQLLRAPGSDPLRPFLLELMLGGVGGLEDGAPDYVSKAEALLPSLLEGTTLPLPARHDAAQLAMKLAYRRGDLQRVRTIAATLGCPQQMRVAGPFGPRELLGFDRDFGIDPGKPLAARYDLGPARGVRDTRDLGARGCSVNLGGSPIGRGGTSYVQGTVKAVHAGRHLLRFESPNSAEVYLDGELVRRIDRREQLSAGVQFIPLELAVGDHLLTLKITTRHPNPVVGIALALAGDADLAASALPLSRGLDAGFPRYLRAAIALLRGDILGARESLGGIERSEQTSALLAMQRASLFLSDPLYPSDLRSDEGRRMLAQALRRDPGLWNPAVQLATMAAENGRVNEAIAALREAHARWPQVPAVGLTLAQMLRGKDWNAEADRVIDAVVQAVPDACGPMNAQLEALRLRKREQGAQKLVEPLMACNARANARYGMLLRQRRWDDALRELDRLQALEPPQNRYAWLLARLELNKSRGDDAEVQRLITELRTRYPQSGTGLVEELDRAIAGGDPAPALAALKRGLATEHESLSEFHRLEPVLGGSHVLDPYRMDGAEAIRRFEASGRSYDEPQVLVFDYMAVRVFDDGSSVEVVHTIQKAQSDEAIDELAEVRVPDGARVLKLHAIKPDGRRLEPDAIAGKDTISLPSVAKGDYVEVEYVMHEPASEGFPAGYLGDRFYFRSFEVPFDYSHMVVVLPRDLPYEVDTRGPAPKVHERMDGDLRVLSFKVEQSEALEGEPGSVAAREYLPSIRVGARATWDAFVESIRDALADRDVRDPELTDLARELVADVDKSDVRRRAERIYSWVLDNVENNNDMFSQVATMVRSKAGNRARVVRHMLQQVGIDAELALVRSATSDITETAMADGDTYEHLLVSFADPAGGEGTRTWIFTAERWAPFGYVPALLRGQPALLLGEAGGRGQVPPTADGADRRSLLLDVTLRSDGGARIDVIETLRGGAAVSWRGSLESIPEAELEHRFEEEYVARLLPGASLAALQIEGRERAAEAVVLRYSFDVDTLGRKVQGGWALPPMLAQKLAHNYAVLATRSTTQLVGRPLDTDVTLRLHLPAGTARPAVPEEVRVEAALPGRPRFELEGRYEGEVLVVERRVRVPLMRVAAKDYPGFAYFCRMVDAAEAKELVVQLAP